LAVAIAAGGRVAVAAIGFAAAADCVDSKVTGAIGFLGRLQDVRTKAAKNALPAIL
jgi:hypothetical protein